MLAKHIVRASWTLKNVQKTARSKNDFFASFLGCLTSPTVIRDHFGTNGRSQHKRASGDDFLVIFEEKTRLEFWSTYFKVPKIRLRPKKGSYFCSKELGLCSGVAGRRR